VGAQEVRWEKGGTVRKGDCKFFYGKGSENRQLGTGFVLHHRIVSAVKTEEFVSDRVSCMVLKGHKHNIFVWNVHAPSKEKRDDSKDRVCEEMEQFFFSTFS
jgi:hypothetical protein